MNTYNFKIDLQCPQCGAPAVLDETEAIIKCGFCKTGNIIHTTPYPCFFISPSAQKPAHLPVTYVPYWRFKGLEFALGPIPPQFRVIDRSNIAVNLSGFPVSLGLRTQTQKLKFIHKDVPGDFLPPAISKKEMLKKIAGEGDRNVYIGEILSLIFMPFYHDGDRVTDGLTGKAVVGEHDFSVIKKAPAYRVAFTPSLCPSCGWDLEGESDSLVLHCRNCTTCWLIHNDQLNQIQTGFFGWNHNTEMMMPFWQFQIRFTTLELNRLKDLVMFANITRVIQDKDKDHRVCFYVPAFKISPKLFLRIGRQITVSQIDIKEKQQIPDVQYHPADLPLDEGFQAVFPMLMDLSVRKKEDWAILSKEKPELVSFKLVYLGFEKVGSEYIQDHLGFSLQVNSLRFGRRL